MTISELLIESVRRGQALLDQRPSGERKRFGQFLTPVAVARYMAKQLGPILEGAYLLDPAGGSGTLALALVEQLVAARRPVECWLDLYEVDPSLFQLAETLLTEAQRVAASHGIILHLSLHQADFVAATAAALQPSLFGSNGQSDEKDKRGYDYVLANPPYFKLSKQDPHAHLSLDSSGTHTNIYSLFMACVTQRLSPDGRACFIVPRSFCSGTYFARFRRAFIQQNTLLAIHLFHKRDKIFDSVLQESVIFTFKKGVSPTQSQSKEGCIEISASNSVEDLADVTYSHVIPKSLLTQAEESLCIFRIPTTELDQQTIEAVDRWPGTLHKHGLAVSTGPVVAFRARPFLTNEQAVAAQQAVPLLWIHNVTPQRVEWPVSARAKPQAISLNAQSLLVRPSNYVVIRRFSTKEEPRRLVAAPLLGDQLPGKAIGLENHLNYIYRESGTLSVEEAIGLSALLSSAVIDRYFRTLNGNTQVNATDLLVLPLPPIGVIEQIGHKIQADGAPDIDAIVQKVLWETKLLPLTLPLLRETRSVTTKIQEAQQLLKALGLPRAQQNELSALTLLVLAQLSEEIPWSEARRQSLRIHDILQEIGERYGRIYAENTRETVRRQVIHQFEQARLVDRNPDEPNLPTNSPRTHYALTDLAIQLIRTYRTDEWTKNVAEFKEKQGVLQELYRRRRQHHQVPLSLSDGSEVYLSPGAHNELQVAIVEEFGPRFAPGATLLYLGDTADKTLILDRTGFEALQLPVPQHDKLPDVVLHDAERNWLFLIEAVTSHGPVSPKRHIELEDTFGASDAVRIYVSAFLDFTTFKSFADRIAWDTEVWIAEAPSHLIHFNGARFLGPREEGDDG